MKKYNILAEGQVRQRYRGKSYMTFGKIYKATFLKKERALKKVKELKRQFGIERIKVEELDTKNRMHYRSGRQLPSGVYTGGSRSVAFYSSSGKKKILEWDRK